MKIVGVAAAGAVSGGARRHGPGGSVDPTLAPGSSLNPFDQTKEVLDLLDAAVAVVTSEARSCQMRAH